MMSYDNMVAHSVGHISATMNLMSHAGQARHVTSRRVT